MKVYCLQAIFTTCALALGLLRLNISDFTKHEPANERFRTAVWNAASGGGLEPGRGNEWSAQPQASRGRPGVGHLYQETPKLVGFPSV